ncbi:MAG: hypothetical protein ABJB86_00985 [Bacteroidota bacterium]
MKIVYTSADLRLHILALEAKCHQQEEDIKHTASAAINSLKPANLIKNTFNSTLKSKGFSKNVLTGVLSLAAGLLSKKLFVMGSSSILKKALGTVVELGVAKAVASNADKITSSGIKLINKAIK